MCQVSVGWSLSIDAHDRSTFIDQPNARREWNANVVVDSGELPGSQQIRLFIGDSGKNDTGSFAKDDLAGVAAVFSSNLTSASATSHLLNITVPLTQALIDKKVGLSAKDVVPKLASGLHWAVEQVSPVANPSSVVTRPFMLGHG